ncbi:unnamed protein product [Rhizopus stolonifer]
MNTTHTMHISPLQHIESKNLSNDSVINPFNQHKSLYSSTVKYPQNSIYQNNDAFSKDNIRKHTHLPPLSSRQSFQTHPTNIKHPLQSINFQNDLLQAKEDTINDHFKDDYLNQQNMQGMMEKRRVRRESHNAVERKRRDNINDRIQELGTLLPKTAENNKISKGTILRKSIEQIRQLQSDAHIYRQKIQELEAVFQQQFYQG